MLPIALSTALSIVGGIRSAHRLYKAVSTVITGDPIKQQLDQISSDVKRLGDSFKVTRLGDSILYAPHQQSVRDVNVSRQRTVDQLRDVRAYLEPVQHALGHEILSSAMILTPEKMQKAMHKNPWDVLLDVCPVQHYTQGSRANTVPILFESEGVRYIGWQLPGILPSLFNCEYHELWTPVSNDHPSPATASRSVTSVSVRSAPAPTLSAKQAPARFLANDAGPRVTLRRKRLIFPVVVQEGEFKKVFGLNEKKRPLKYIQNEYEERGEVVVDSATGLMWQQSGSQESMFYAKAKKYIQQLKQQKFAEYSDWRLPTIPELLSLLEPDRKNRNLYGGNFYIDPIFDKTQNVCWSADLRLAKAKSSSVSVWSVQFASGFVCWGVEDHTNYYVRAVRS